MKAEALAVIAWIALLAFLAMLSGCSVVPDNRECAMFVDYGDKQKCFMYNPVKKSRF